MKIFAKDPSDKGLCLSSDYYKRITQIRWLNNRHLFLRVLEARKSKIKIRIDLVCGEDPFLDFRMPTSGCILTWKKENKRARDTNNIQKSFILMT